MPTDDNPQTQAVIDGGQAQPVNSTAQTQEAGQVSDLPAWAQQVIGDLRKESAARRKAHDEAQAQLQAAADVQLANEKKWEELANKRKADLDAATSRLSMLDRLTQLTQERIDSELKGWPAEVRALDPGGDDLLARLEWLEHARPLVGKLAQAATQTRGNTPSPKPGGGTTPVTERQSPALRL